MKTADCNVRLVTVNSSLATSWNSDARPDAILCDGLADNRILNTLEFMYRSVQQAPRGAILVLFNSELLPVTALLKPYIAWKKISIVHDVHEMFYTRRGKFLLKYLSLIADHNIGVSEFMLEQIHPCARTHSTVVHRPIDGRGPSDGWGETEHLRVGIIGRISPDKRIEIAIDAVASMADNSTRLVVRGSAPDGGEDYAEGVRSYAKVRLGNRAIFEGFTSPDRLYDGLDASVLCNTTEPSGRVVIESQAAGVPVLVPAAGGATEYVSDGLGGFVYAPGSPVALGQILQRLQEQRPLLRRMRQVAMDRASRQYTPSSIAHDYIDAISAV